MIDLSAHKKLTHEEMLDLQEEFFITCRRIFDKRNKQHKQVIFNNPMCPLDIIGIVGNKLNRGMSQSLDESNMGLNRNIDENFNTTILNDSIYDMVNYAFFWWVAFFKTSELNCLLEGTKENVK